MCVKIRALMIDHVGVCFVFKKSREIGVVIGNVRKRGSFLSVFSKYRVGTGIKQCGQEMLKKQICQNFNFFL